LGALNSGRLGSLGSGASFFIRASTERDLPI